MWGTSRAAPISAPSYSYEVWVRARDEARAKRVLGLRHISVSSLLHPAPSLNQTFTIHHPFTRQPKRLTVMFTVQTQYWGSDAPAGAFEHR